MGTNVAVDGVSASVEAAQVSGNVAFLECQCQTQLCIGVSNRDYLNTIMFNWETPNIVW